MAKNTSFDRAKEMIFFQLENLTVDENFKNAEEANNFLQRAQTTSELISQYCNLEKMKTDRINAVSNMIRTTETNGFELSEIKSSPLLVE